MAKFNFDKHLSEQVIQCGWDTHNRIREAKSNEGGSMVV